MTTKERLKALCESFGVAGEESSASAVAAGLLREFTDDVEIDDFHNVIANIYDAGADAPRMMLDAHIDEIGMIVTHLTDDGFVYVAACGGMDRRLLLAQEVVIHGQEPVCGIVATTPPHLATAEETKTVPKVEEIMIDTGLSRENLHRLVSLGDRVTLKSRFTELQNDRISCKSLDDRAGVAAILHTLDLVRGKELPCSLTVLFSSQEEVGGRGVSVATWRINPDYALTVDVSFAVTPDADPKKCGEMSKGAMIGIAPLLHRPIYEELLMLARTQRIPYQVEVMGRSTGTNADEITTVRGGVKTGLLSIPQKYMHTPIEICDVADIEAVGNLMAQFLLHGEMR